MSCLTNFAYYGGKGEHSVNLLKKENVWQKIYFLDNTEWSSKKLWKMVSFVAKANVNAIRSKRTGS